MDCQGGAASDVAALLSRMQSLASSTHRVEDDQDVRAQMLQLSRQLTANLEQPDEVVSLVAFSGGRNMCVRVADDLKLFDILTEHAPNSIAVNTISKISGAEEGLLLRILRTLAGMGFVRQVAKSDFVATPVSMHMTKASVRAGVRFFYDEGLPVLASMPVYFKDNGYRLPCSSNDGPLQYAYGTHKDSYSYWSTEKPATMTNFNAFMQGLFGTPQRLGWTDWFPLKEVCLDGYDGSKSDYLFVDVAGGKGHECELLLRKYPHLQGKIVLEELPFVIDDVSDLDSRVERVKHDFTTPQPIRGARVYFLQNILHNWASPVCLQILKHINDAMQPGYSKLLVGNIILPDENVPLRQSGLDIAMLFMHSGSQRSGAEWRALLEEAGFHVVRVWTPDGDGDGVIEAEVL